MSYHFTPVRMAVLRKTRDNKCWQGCREKGTLVALLVGMQIVAATMENSVEGPQKTKNRTVT